MSFRQLRNGRFSPNLAVGRESWWRRFWTEIYEKFPFRGHLPRNPQTLRGQTLRASYCQVKGCTADIYCIFYVVVQGPGSFRYLVQRRPTVAELRGVKVAQFSDLGLFSPYKTPKTYLPVASLQTRGYIAEWFRFIRVIVEGPKGCRPAVEFFSDFW